MGKVWDLLNSNSWEEYQRIQLYKKIGKKLEPEALKKMGFGEAMGTLAVMLAQARLRKKQKNNRKNKKKIVSVPNNSSNKKRPKIYHLTKKELEKIIANAKKGK